MKVSFTKATSIAAAIGFMGCALGAPIAANASTQSDKNMWRNLGIGSAVIAGYGLLNHNNGLAALGAVGAAVGGSQYEKDRKTQSQNSWNYNRGGYNQNDNRNYNRGGYNQNDNRNYNRDGYNQNRDDQNYNRNDDRSDDNQGRDNRDGNRR